MLRQHGEKELEKFLEFLNCYHGTIKFIANYSRQEMFLAVSDLYIKPTDTDQCLHASSCHVYHSKKFKAYSQLLRSNIICSENSLYDKRCNKLEVCLREPGYSDRLVRQKILKSRKHKRKGLLNDMADKRNDNKLVFNITYHLNISILKDTMSFLHQLLLPHQEHQ